MKGTDLQRIIESLLFVSDGPLQVSRLQRLLEVEQAELDSAIADLVAAAPQRGVQVQVHGGGIQMTTAPEAGPYVEKLIGVQQSSKLSPAALETLAIIAYRQPITRAGIEAIRGVNVDRAVATLQSRGLIAESGRMEAVGRPIVYATTFEFLQHFGLQSLAELPALEELADRDVEGLRE